jgi:hypothetical protein
MIWAALGTVAIATATILTSTVAQRAGWPVGENFLGGDFLLQAPQIFGIAARPASLGLTAAILLVSWWATATYAYLMFLQLRLISQIYSHHTEIHFFRLGPLYAFSRQTLRGALGLLILAYALFATAREVYNSPVGFVSWALLVSGALAVFFLPLLGIHRQLVREKARLLGETGRRLEAGLAKLHQRIDDREFGKIDEINKALASLELERAAFERIPTWPWERGTLRGLLAAVVVPIPIWLAQFGLQRFLAR